MAEALAKLHVVGATVVGHSLGGTVATALAEQSPSLASRIVIIDQSPEDGFEHESLGSTSSLAPVIGQAIARLIQVAARSRLIRDQYDQAFAPGYDISERVRQPRPACGRPARHDLHRAQGHRQTRSRTTSIRSPLDRRLAATHLPLLVIFGAEDQIYDPRRPSSATGRYPARRPI